MTYLEVYLRLTDFRKNGPLYQKMAEIYRKSLWPEILSFYFWIFIGPNYKYLGYFGWYKSKQLKNQNHGHFLSSCKAKFRINAFFSPVNYSSLQFSGNNLIHFVHCSYYMWLMNKDVALTFLLYSITSSVITKVDNQNSSLAFCPQ